MNNAQRKGLADIIKNTTVAVLVGFGFQAVFKDKPVFALIAVVFFLVGIAYTMHILRGINDE